jgi:hypothetical protein
MLSWLLLGYQVFFDSGIFLYIGTGCDFPDIWLGNEC